MMGRISYLISDFEGGTANHLLSILRHLDDRDWSPSVLSTDPRAEGKAENDVPLFAYERPGSLHRFPLAQIRELSWAHRQLRSRPVHLLHTYFYWPIMYGRLLKKLGSISTLVENREDEGFDWGEREYRILRATRRLPDRVIAVSESVKRVVVNRERIEPERVRIVHNAIEDPGPVDRARVRQLRARLNIETGTSVVGYVGNYERPVKGLRYLLESVPRVRNEVPDTRFIIVGRGPDAYRRIATKLGVNSAVSFVGASDDVDAYYALFDVSVLPSLSEGLSLTLLESMAHGLPVVASRAGGNPEVVANGESGYLVPPRDVEALAGRIVDLLRSPERRSAMARKARAVIEGGYLQPAAAREYHKIYNELIA